MKRSIEGVRCGPDRHRRLRRADKERQSIFCRRAFVRKGRRTILHEEFAERVAERLEARVDTLENEERPPGRAATTVCVRELRVAAEMAREEAATVTVEEAPLPEAQA